MLALVTQYLHCIYNYLHNIWAFPGGSGVKNPPAKQETQVQSLGQEDPLEKGMATHSIVSWNWQELATHWRIPWPEEPSGLQSIGSQRLRHDLVTKHHTT